MSENNTAAGDMQLCWEKKHGNYILYDTHGRGGGSGLHPEDAWLDYWSDIAYRLETIEEAFLIDDQLAYAAAIEAGIRRSIRQFIEHTIGMPTEFPSN